jgi:predicted metalloprotease
LTGIALILLVNFLSGGDVNDALKQLESIPIDQQQNAERTEFEGEDDYEVFASAVLGSNNDMWTSIFSRSNRTYTSPRLVLFRTATESACGMASSQVGPHYCPLDQSIYLDETFFDALMSRFGAQGGDVAEAYVIAHEVGHHAQNELGIMDQVQTSEQSDTGKANELSVKLELQADCFAGLWAHSIKHLEVILPGEIDEAMDAAAAVGDDRIQQKVTGYINPESWTHGSSRERVAWFNKGYESGVLSICNTFN